jgi:hypothetical protein
MDSNSDATVPPAARDAEPETEVARAAGLLIDEKV